MKKRLACFLCLLLLCGCGQSAGDIYTVVEPHNENYVMAVDSDAMTVSSYLSLKNAILNLVADGIPEGVIRAESYAGNLDEDLTEAVYEVSHNEPLGAFAVDYMTYDYSKIVSYYEINVHTSFRRGKDAMDKIVYVDSMEAAENQIALALQNLDLELCLMVGDYHETEISDVLQKMYLEHPEYVLEKPYAAVKSYPDSGTQRILEIEFEYKTDLDLLEEYCQKAQKRLAELVDLYGSDNDPEINATRLYNRLCRDAVLLGGNEKPEPYADGIYGALMENTATNFGYARTYCAMLRMKDVSCELQYGTVAGQDAYWCRLELDGEIFYADPAYGVLTGEKDRCLMTPEQLNAFGYQVAEE